MRIEDSWTALASAIVDRAINDRKQALSMLNEDEGNIIALETLKETHEFFHSEWCEELLAMSRVNTDGKRIQEIIDEC